MPAIAPGPKGQFLLGSYLALRKNHIRLFLDAHREYGDVVRLRLGPNILHLVVHPKDIEYVLRENQANYPKTDFHHRIECIFGLGLLTSVGDLWRRQRRIIQPAFQPGRFDGILEVVASETEAMLRRWDDVCRRGEVLDVGLEARKVSLEIVARAMFGTSVFAGADVLDHAFTQATSALSKRLTSPVAIPVFLPTPQNRRLRHALSLLDPVIYRMIAERRPVAKSRADLLSMLLEARDQQTGEAMSDRQIRDEIVTILFAGYDSPSTGIAWAWYHLAQNPEMRAKLEAEARSVLGDDPPTPSDAKKLPYTTMVYAEALRLAAPGGNVGRQPVKDDTIGGYHIPAGSAVVVNAHVTHRHPEIWQDPERFLPERFRSEEEDKRPECSYLPFGEGPRKCIGANLSMVQGPLILAAVARRYRLDLVPDQRVELEPDLTYRPKYGLRARLERVPA